MLLISVFFPISQIEQTAQVFFQKLVIADSYRPVSKVKANVLLFKASDTPSKLSADYGLSEVHASMKYYWFNRNFAINTL